MYLKSASFEWLPRIRPGERRTNVAGNGEAGACTRSRMVKELEWIEMAQLAVSSILFKSSNRFR